MKSSSAIKKNKNIHRFKMKFNFFNTGLAALPGTDPLTDHHASQQHHQHLQQHHQQQQQTQPQSWGWVAVDDAVVVDGVAGDVGDAVVRHGDPFQAEPPTLC